VKTFWDTSAAINALVSPDVFARLDEGEHFARLHLLSEFFATMTGRGIRVLDEKGQPAQLSLSAGDAAKWLRMFAGKVTLMDLNGQELLDGLDKAEQKSVQGGKVYDYTHALAADKVTAEELITRNTKDFSGLTRANLVWP